VEEILSVTFRMRAIEKSFSTTQFLMRVLTKFAMLDNVIEQLVESFYIHSKRCKLDRKGNGKIIKIYANIQKNFDYFS